MKKELLGGVAAIALIAAAGVSGPAAAQEAFDWTGFYLGAHTGYGDADYEGGFRLDDSDTLAFAEDLDLEGILAGAHLGYNHHVTQNIVVGVEGDLTFMFWHDSLPAVDPPAGNESEAINGDVDMLASVRVRLGYAAGNFLPYVTAGIAYAVAEYGQKRFASPPFSDSVTFTDVGYAIGGGLEYRHNEDISVRAQALYYGFNNEIFEPFGDCGGSACGRAIDGDFVKFEDVITYWLGVTWHF